VPDSRFETPEEAPAKPGVDSGETPTLVSCGLRRDDRLRFGGEAVPTRGQSDLSLFFRPAPAPLL
jgi:hypothetical protein